MLTAHLVALVLAVGALVLVQAPATAAPATPTGLRAETAGPVLSWDPVAAATGYEVEISARSDFSTRLWTRSTVNTRLVPDLSLPSGTLHWRVRAKEGSTVGDWSDAALDVATAAAPSILPVTDGGDPVRQPDAPPLLRWTRVPGAVEYQVQVGTDPAFTDPAQFAAHETRTLSWLVADSASQLPGNTYTWRVRADLGNGVLSAWSGNGGYSVEGLPRPTEPSPADNAGGVPVQDVVLDWAPVPGAARYDVRISADENFSSGVTTVRTVATRWSPPETVGNDEYYWQVRPVDALGTQTPWEDVDTWEFRRSWPDQPALTYPGDGAVVGDPLFVQWEPVPLASGYTVEFSLRADFPADSRVTRSCSTTSTTLVVDSLPAPNKCLLPSYGPERYFWRVQGVDEPENVVTDLISAEVRSFVYRPERATPTAPTGGSTVAVPTMRWQPAQGAESYEVSWTPLTGGTTKTERTTSTSFTPADALEAGTTYRWDVRTISAEGRVGTGLAPEVQARFTTAEAVGQTGHAPDPLELVTAPTTRFPTLRWTPVADADHYRLRLRAAGDSTYAVQDRRFDYPAGELTTEDDLVTGTWFWQVEAWDGSTFLGTGREGRFTIAPSGDVGNHRASLVGTGTGSPDTWCDMGLPDRCQNLDQTPVIRWDPVPGASAYRVEVTFDRERTSELPSPLKGEFWTSTSMWAYDEQLPDSQAGAAYFVSVRPCKTANVLTCEPEVHADHAVNKLSTPVQLTTPAEAAPVVPPVADDVTFTWRDHLATNQDPALPRDATRVAGTLGARTYEIEVSSDRAFTSSSSRVVREVVDQTTFTAPGTTLPEGLVYWRVRAIDGSGNALPWSAVRSVEKRSPRPTPLTPAPRTTVDGGEPFRWEPLAFAASYDVEVQRNGVVLTSAGGTTKQTAFAPEEPLPAGTGYSWRVRRGDASGRKGEWSDPVPFSVRGASARAVAPGEGEDVAPAGALFSWDIEPSAARYRFQRRVVGATSTSENVLTRAPAYAPTGRITAGRHEWRVVALDSDDAELGASAWRGFTVQDKPTAPSPQVSGSTRVGNTLTAVEPDWSMPDVETTVQWYRGSTPIPGATTLEVGTTTADVGQTLKARFTGLRPGWAPGTVDSVGVKVTPGAAPQLISALDVEGSGRVGTELRLGPVSWDMPDVVTTYQWIRDGSALRGETNSTYTLEADDVGDTLVVRVTGRRSGYDDAVVEGPAVTATAGEAPTALTPPGVTGSTVVGQTLTATNGEWSTDGLVFDHQWLRDGQPIPRATSGTYRLAAEDAGRRISVRVVADRSGFAQGSATSAARTVAKLTSTTVTDLSTSRVRKGRPVLVEVEVDATGTTPTGSVTLLADGRKVGTQRLDTRGEATVRYVPRATGKDKLVAKYGGSTTVAASQSRAATLTVTR